MHIINQTHQKPTRNLYHPLYLSCVAEAKTPCEPPWVVEGEGVWHAIAILLCAVCISLNFLGLALLPGHVTLQHLGNIFLRYNEPFGYHHIVHTASNTRCMS